MTIRTHDQFNTTIYGLHDRYRGIENERRVVLMNEDDMKNLGFDNLELINIISVHENQERKAVKFYAVPYSIPSGSVATYFPEANCLIPLHNSAERSNTPISKFVVVRFERYKGEEA